MLSDVVSIHKNPDLYVLYLLIPYFRPLFNILQVYMVSFVGTTACNLSDKLIGRYGEK